MKKFVLAAACLAALSSVCAHAETIGFSYAFSDGTNVLTGTLNGDLVGGQVQNISDLQVALNGVAFTGPLLLGSFNSGTGLFDTAPPVLSTNATLNNFVFTDGADINSVTSNYFYMSSGAGAAFGTAVFGGFVDGLADGDSLVTDGKWNLQPVPLPAGLLLFSSGLSLVGALRRRRASV